MKIEIRQNLSQASQLLKDHAQKKILFALSRFGDRIRSITLRVMDINGPKGGLDKKCQVLLKLKNKTIVLEGVDQNYYTVVDTTIERLQRLVARELERWRDGRFKQDTSMKRSIT